MANLLSRQALLQLASDLPRYEAEALLLACLNITRVQLRLHPDELVSELVTSRWQSWLARYRAGEPLAYLEGQTEFFGLRLKVTPAVLCPRPDSELIVETVLQLALPTSDVTVLDLGTGSGALALALQAQRPQWRVIATDRANEALQVAQYNAKQLNLPVQFYLGDWFDALAQRQQPRFDVIVSNPPYLAADDPHLSHLQAEPQAALVAKNAGLSDLQQIISQAHNYLKPHGWLWLEHGWTQASAVRQELVNRGFSHVETKRDYGQQERISGGQWL